jgi:uncharacterized protein YjiS (DUF1127 family)
MTLATLRHPAFDLSALLKNFVQWRQRIARERQARAELRTLMALGQHELNDLGVGRSELAQRLHAPV